MRSVLQDRRAEVGSEGETLVVVNCHGTSVRFPFASLANKRRKVVITPVNNSHRAPTLRVMSVPPAHGGVWGRALPKVTAATCHGAAPRVIVRPRQST